MNNRHTFNCESNSIASTEKYLYSLDTKDLIALIGTVYSKSKSISLESEDYSIASNIYNISKEDWK